MLPMQTNDPSAKKILAIDDDSATRDALPLFLQGEGDTVSVVKNGKDALDSQKPSGFFRPRRRKHRIA